MNKFIATVKIIFIGVMLSIGLSYLHAWTGPTATPPGGNIAAPINIGDNSQSKLGQLFLNTSTSSPYTIGLAAFGESVFTSNSSGTAAIQINDGTAAAGKVLTATDASGTAMWESASGTGGVGGIYEDILSTHSAPSGSGWTDSGLDITLTPETSSSKFLINANIAIGQGTASGNCAVGLFNGSNALIAPFVNTDTGGDNFDTDSESVTYVDTTANTATRTYSIKTSGNCYINQSNSGGFFATSSMSIVEFTG